MDQNESENNEVQRLGMHKILQRLTSPWDKVDPEKNRNIDFSERDTKG